MADQPSEDARLPPEGVQLASTRQAAELLGVSVRTIRHLCQRGELRAWYCHLPGEGSHRPQWWLAADDLETARTRRTPRTHQTFEPDDSPPAGADDLGLLHAELAWQRRRADSLEAALSAYLVGLGAPPQPASEAEPAELAAITDAHTRLTALIDWHDRRARLAADALTAAREGAHPARMDTAPSNPDNDG